ncbi:MAG: tRNA epoxyqueuosine(34) reductase QueG [Actinomycetia bacterium]|nr:tRNA epoxyqueuosine(34) reductase QueG [Actinomycetes bacterium]MCP4085975.1 tRNA epoxyqueuosine(34) reductase QueG [Actinomycetes bacterium]
MTPTLDELRAVGLANGLDVVGAAAADPFSDTLVSLRGRSHEGLAGSMQFTYRNPDRSTEPNRVLPAARSLVVGARHYRPARSQAESVSRPRGRVARYAQHDHYGALRDGLDAVAGVLTDAGWGARVVFDDNAMVDRAAAHRAGLGWFGKNTNLLLPGHGSWFVLGAVVTDAGVDSDAHGPAADGCGPCTRCLDGCPTGAIIRPGVVDATRCLAWSVQAPGVFPRDQRVALGDRLYGCDECQDVCPPNRIDDRRQPGFCSGQADVDLLELLATDDSTLLERFGRWYIGNRDPRHLRRTALVVLGNVARPDDPKVVEVLVTTAFGPDDLLAAHAVWALGRLGRGDLLAGLESPPGTLTAVELAVAAPVVREVVG